MRTEFVSGSKRQCRVNAIFPGFIICRGDNASFRWIALAADNHRLAFQSRIPFLFDSGEKSIHVDMQNSSWRRFDHQGTVHIRRTPLLISSFFTVMPSSQTILYRTYVLLSSKMTEGSVLFLLFHPTMVFFSWPAYYSLPLENSGGIIGKKEETMTPGLEGRGELI